MVFVSDFSSEIILEKYMKATEINKTNEVIVDRS